MVFAILFLKRFVPITVFTERSNMKKKYIKVTVDYVIDEYLVAKKLTGKKKDQAMARVEFLSKNLNRLIESDKN